MAAINPDAHEIGFQPLPEKCVTATFSTATAAKESLSRLRDAGFAEAQLLVYLGEPGAAHLDVGGENLSVFSRFVQALTHALADDAEYLDRADAILKRGGALVSVDTGDDEQVVRRAASVLKGAGGSAVQHWGQ